MNDRPEYVQIGKFHISLRERYNLIYSFYRIDWSEQLSFSTFGQEIQMIIVVFRSRLRAGIEKMYKEEAMAVAAVAREVPGYIAHRSFVAEDGERVTIVEYGSEDALRAWARDPRHVAAKKLGRKEFYVEYKVQICSLIREGSFMRA
jgi:heme-degrading monooxygenase HmoA